MVLCARAWGMLPREVERRSHAGEVSGVEILETVLLEMADPWRGPVIHGWLFREKKADREALLARIQSLVLTIQATPDGPKREALLAELAEAQKG